MSEHTVRSERGAILIQTAVASVVLLGLGAFAVDYGVLWVSRGQAQIAADAGAMAGALSRAYDDLNDPPTAGGIVYTSATQVAQRQNVWSEVPSVAVSVDCPADLEGFNSGHCVRVDVSRDAESGNPLPTYFGPVLGVTSQDVRATATAQVRVGNATDCLRPWAIPDRWVEHRPSNGPWDSTAQFQRYAEGSPLGTLLPIPVDEYDPPSISSTGTGLNDSDHAEMTLTLPPDQRVFPGWFQPLDLPGSNTYAQNISGCNGNLVAIGQQVAISGSADEPETTQGWNDLIALDPSARWNRGQDAVQQTCAPVCAPISPRIVAIAAFNVDEYEQMRAANDWSGCPTGGRCVRIVNIFGFFIDSVDGPGVVSGYLTTYPGTSTTDNPPFDWPSSFLKAITLVR
jgi:Flp pilus assembly protein TadG